MKLPRFALMGFAFSAFANSGSCGDWNARSLDYDFLARGTFSNSGENLFLSRSGHLGPIHGWDYNGDGYADVIFNNTHDHSFEIPVRIFLNRSGIPTAQNPIELPGSGAASLAVADLNKDGWKEIIVVNGNNNTTGRQNSWIYWGNKDGWSAGRCQGLLTLQGNHVTVADLNADGNLDLIFSNRGDKPGDDRKSFVYWGNGRDFGEDRLTELPTDAASCSVAADFDADGHCDIAFGNRGSKGRPGGVTVYWGASDGFKASRSVKLEGDQTVVAMQLVDLDGDGIRDLLVADSRPQQKAKTGFYPAKKDGFGKFVALPVGHATAIATGDFSKLGSPQIAVATYQENAARDAAIAIFSRQPDGQWLRKGSLPTKRSLALSVGDVNADGYDDLLAAEYWDRNSKSISSHLFAGGTDGLKSSQAYATHGASGALITDADGDGKPDVLFANSSTGRTYGDIEAYVYFGNPQFDYSPKSLVKLPAIGDYNSVSADFNNDGYIDALLVTSGEDDADDFLKKGSFIYWGSKEGLSPDHRTELPLGARGFGVTAADLNRDGYLDVILGDLNDQALRIYYGSEKGFSDAHLTKLKGGAPMFVRAVDLNRDGWLDIVSPRIVDNKVVIFWNSADGFNETDQSEIPHSAPSVAEFADLNADGWLDMIVGGFWDATTQDHRTPSSIYWGGREGFSNAHRTLLLMSGVTDVSVADLNRDGHLDIAFSNYHGNTTRAIDSYVYWGNGKGFSDACRSALPTLSASGNLILDLNEDDWPDIVFSNHNKNNDHHCDSVIYWGGKKGFATDRVTWLPAVGPHQMADVDPGNLQDRSLQETYVSPILDLGEHPPTEAGFAWKTFAVRGSDARFSVRAADTTAALADAPWGQAAGPSQALPELAGKRFVQFQIVFSSQTGAAQSRVGNISLLTK